MARQAKRIVVLCVAVAVAMMLIPAGISHAVVLDGLVGHWNFDGDYLDTTVSGNDGVASGSPTFSAGHLGQALSVTGLDHVRTQDNSVISGTQARTVNVWFNAATLQTEAPLSGGTQDSGRVFDLYHNNTGSFGGHFYGGGYDTLAGTNPTYSAGQWTMATLVYDGGTKVDVYDNGTFVKSATMPGQLNTDATSLYMGGGGGYSATRDYSGLVDDVSIWNRQLTAAEIESVYEAAAEGYSLSAPKSPLALQFDFSDNNGAAVGYLGPGHQGGFITGDVWNTIQGNFSGTAKDELGGDVPNITVEFGATASGAITNWGTVGLGEFVNATGAGVHDTELMTDMIYVSSGSRNQAGVRIKGLPVGDYQVFFMPRHYLLTEPLDIAIGVNVDQLAGNSFTSPDLSTGLTEWVEGTDLRAGNYFSQVVHVSGSDDWVVMLADQLNGSTINDFLGFQIARIPEPSSLILFGLGTLMLACRPRRRRAAAR